MFDMDELPCIVAGPIRSRFRGLSWDKKHQGWRVRIYYSGKQRHVGRFEDDITAAKAYDKAAVYLYGANAITNFGLSQVAEDPVEVSAFIVLAKEQADQEQACRGQQRLRGGCTVDSRMVKAAQQLLPSSSVLPGHLLLNCSSYSVLQTSAYPQRQLHPMCDDSLAWQQQLHGMSSMQGNTPQQQQQVWCHPPGLDQQAVMMAPPGAALDTLSSSISNASSACTMSAAAGSATSNTSSPVSAVGSSTSYMLCTTPGGQHVLVPVSAAVGGAAGPLTAVYSGMDASGLMSQQQLQAQQLLAAQQQLGHSMVAQTQQLQQQQQQHNLLLMSGSATTQPMQLSVQPQLTTIAGHMAAAQVPAAQQQQLQQQLAMLVPITSAPSWSSSNNSMPAVSAAAGADSAAAAAAALVNRPATSAGSTLTQPACASTGSNTYRAAMLAGNAAGAPLMHATSSFVEDMLRGLDCYTPAAMNAVAANQVGPTQQQQAQQPLLQQVLLGSSRAAGDSMVDCSSSSSCSPMFGVQRMLLETSTINPSPGYGLMGQLGHHNNMSVMTSHGASFGSAQMVPSPTCCNGGSHSQSLGAHMHVMY